MVETSGQQSSELIVAQTACNTAESAVIAAHDPPVNERLLRRLREVSLAAWNELAKQREKHNIPTREAVETPRAATLDA
ncbi:hypothetical protein BIV57_05250 [Mangrovactinospora gilvigrisea]|uniref:Uncharacterized protein n=1 Tax=Mangrovactinospora gilvigrisea TaxID=1428644 RepID=A0A1J7BIY0_9ACTN|nr:hypothetical protein [Mangrovactinospora gilvigrisea]OIV38541.1 hypothetical protein BIV57_05250 [Mangrovactinospora gilvigrisea]